VKFLREKEPHFEQVVTIREVYYDDDGNITMCSASDCGISPKGDSVEELREDINKMWKSLVKPVLIPKDIPGYQYEEDEIPYEDDPDEREIDTKVCN
jgi:hypothetical protein